MTGVLDRLVAPAPVERLAVLRILVGAYATGWAALRLPEHLAYLDQPAHHWRPSGVWSRLDTPPPDLVVVVLALSAPVLGALFAAGWRFGSVGPVFALTLLGLATLDSSWGQIFQLLGDRYSPLGTWLVTHGWTFRPLAIATLAVELGAPVALLGNRWRTAWVVAAWTFHLGVLALMAILFAYPLSGVAFAPFFRLERLAAKVRSWFGTAQLWAGAEHVVGDESPAPPDQRLRP